MMFCTFFYVFRVSIKKYGIDDDEFFRATRNDGHSSLPSSGYPIPSESFYDPERDRYIYRIKLGKPPNSPKSPAPE